MVRHKGGMRQGRARSHNLSAADVDPPIGLFDRVHAHVGALVNGPITIHWGMYDKYLSKSNLVF